MSDAGPPEPQVSRREAITAAAGAALLLSAAGCGRITPLRPNRTAYPILAAGISPPPGDLLRLLGTRARAVEMAPTFSLVSALEQQDALRRETRAGQYDPRADRTPPVNGVVVVGVLDPRPLVPLAQAALRRGARLVSYPVALVPGAIAVRVDFARSARALVDALVTAPRMDGAALLVLPPANHVALNAFAGQAAELQTALVEALARAAPGLTVLATVAARAPDTRRAVARALAEHPELRLVLVWDDAAALGAVAAVRQAGATGRCAVGALGAPAVSSRATFAEVRRGGVLRAVVAARPRELADALVDLPKAVLAGRRVRDRVLTPHLLTADAAGLRRYETDYARRPVPLAFDRLPLNPTLEPPR